LLNVKLVHAQVVVFLVWLAQLVTQERMDDLVNQVAQDPQVFQADPHRTATQQHHPHANPAQQDQPDLRDQMDLQETTDQTERPEAQERKEAQVPQGLLDHQDQPETTELMDQLEIKEKTDPKKPKSQENKDQPEKMVAPDQRDPQETPDPTELPDSPEQKDLQDQLAQTAKPEMQEKMASQEQPDPQETREFVPNIVHSMVEYFSKTEPEVKYFGYNRKKKDIFDYPQFLILPCHFSLHVNLPPFYVFGFFYYFLYKD